MFLFSQWAGRRRSSSWDFLFWHHLFCLIILISKSVTCRGVSFQPVLTCVSVRFQVAGVGRINANYGHLGQVLTVTKFWSTRTASLSSPLPAPVGHVLIVFFKVPCQVTALPTEKSNLLSCCIIDRMHILLPSNALTFLTLNDIIHKLTIWYVRQQHSLFTAGILFAWIQIIPSSREKIIIQTTY